MKYLVLLVVLPVALFPLERVNLIKNGSFEKDNDVWQSYVGGTGLNDIPAIVSDHDSENAFSGFYSASSDTRPVSKDLLADSTVLMQGFSRAKKVGDIDSLTFYHSVTPVENDFTKTRYAYAAIYLNASQPYYVIGLYYFKSPDFAILNSEHRMIFSQQNFIQDTAWHAVTKGIGKDLDRLGISPDASVDSLILAGSGDIIFGPWRGQKIYWDSVRLTGYADYDVGVKYLLSPDSIGTREALGESLRNSPMVDYIPMAGIKNFGRKASEEFLAIAEIVRESGVDSGFVIWADTIPYTLPADTEDTLEFGAFTPSQPGPYTLTVRTTMTSPEAIDESDEDDALSKTLYGSEIEEQPTLQGLNLDVMSLQGEEVLRVSYSLPLEQQGTISLYDPSGRRIESLTVTGLGSINLKSNLSSGVYFVKLETKHSTLTKKAVILR